MTEVAAAQDAAAEIARLHAQNQQLSAKLHEESVRVQGFFDAAAVKAAAAAETANATAQCDSRITGISRNSVGVDKGVYARQQAELKRTGRSAIKRRFISTNLQQLKKKRTQSK